MKFDNDIFNSFNKKPNDLKLSAHYYNENTLIIELIGVLDTFNSNDFGNLIINIIDNFNGEHIVLDFKDLTYAMSIGIGKVAELVIYSNNKRIELHLFNLPDKIKEMFELLGFYPIFSHVDNLNNLNKDNKIYLDINCLKCDTKIRIFKSGSFKCPKCQQLMIVTDDNNLIIGE